MFELCVVYLFKSSLSGSTLLTACLELLRPALRPGSPGQVVSGVVLSRHFGPSSRILAGPVSGERDLSFCDLSYSFSYFLSILFLLFLGSVCSVVLCAGSALWSSSVTVVSSSKSSTLEAEQSSPRYWGTQVLTTGATKSSRLGAAQSNSSPLQARGTQVLKTEATKSSRLGAAHSTRSSPHYWGTQVLTTEAIKSSIREATTTSPLRLRKLTTNNQPSSSEVISHRRRPPADLAAVQHSTASCMGATIKALDQLKAFPATTSEEVDFISSKDVDRTLSSIIHLDNTLSADSFTDALSATRELGEQLLCFKAGHQGLATFIRDLDAIQETLSNKSDLNQVSELQDLQSLFTSLRSQWQTANHPSEHSITSELNSCQRVLTNLAAEVSTARDWSDTHSTSPSSSSPPTLCYTMGKNYLPTIAMPNVSGDILDWNTFWASISSIIKDRKEPNLTQRLHCLREAIPYSALQLLLHSTAENSDFSTTSREKFNKTQELHTLLCKTLIYLPGSKQTRTNLSKLVDLVERTISSLKTIKHSNSDSFLSSLVCSILISNLQTSWAQLLFIFTSFPIFNQPFFRSSINLSSDLQSQLLLFLRKHAETLPASGAPLPSHSFEPTPRKNSTKKTDKRQQPQPKQRSHVYSVSSPSFTLTSQQLPDALLIHQGATSAVHVSSTLSESQQLPDALLMTVEVLLKAPDGQLLKARAFISPDAGLSLISTQTVQALKLPLEASTTTFSTVQGTECKGSQHLTSVITSPLHSKLNIQCTPADVRTVTGTFNISGRVDILLEAVAKLPIRFLPIIASASEPGAQYIISGWAITGTAKAQGPLQQKRLAYNLLSNLSIEHSTNLASDFSLADLAVEPELSLSPAGPQVEQQHVSHSNHSNHVSFPPHNCRQQTTHPEKSDCQPPGEDSRQAVLPNLALSQQPWEKNQKHNSSWRDGTLCLSATQLLNSLTLTGSDSISPELHEFSDSSLQNCGAVVHTRTTSKEHPPFTFLATSKPSSWTCVPTAEQSTICVNTEVTPEVLLPLPFWRKEPPLLSEYPGPTLQQPPQKELLELPHSLTLKQPPQKELLKHSPPVDTSTSLSTMAVDLGNLSLTYSHIPSHTDWCWEFCSTFIYNGALLSAATNCVPLVVANHQTPAASSVPTLTGTEKKTAELWLLKQAKLHLVNSEKLSTIKRRFFSKSIRLKPWHPHLICDQMLTAGRLPANSCTCKWRSLFHLTLCLCGSVFSCITGINILLLSARRLSRFVYSNSYWRKQPHLQHLQTAECPTTSSQRLASATDHSSDPMVHPQLLQGPSPGLSLQLCYFWTDSSIPLPCPDSKPKTSSTSWANKFNSNPEETSPAPWRSVSTEDTLADCSFRSKLLLYLLLLLLHFLLPLITLQPSKTATLITL